MKENVFTSKNCLLAYVVYENHNLNKYYNICFKIMKSIHGNFNLIFNFFLNRKKKYQWNNKNKKIILYMSIIIIWIYNYKY